MSNLNDSAFPIPLNPGSSYQGHGPADGFTKRERACIGLRIPESGDTELDALIEKARRQEMATKALPECYREYMAGCRAQEHGCQEGWKVGISIDALNVADSLIAVLERTDG